MIEVHAPDDAACFGSFSCFVLATSGVGQTTNGPPPVWGVAGLELRDAVGYASTDLPRDPLPIPVWNAGPIDFGAMYGTVTRIEAVPEPATLGLLAVGLLGTDDTAARPMNDALGERMKR